jgi:hypothetical protein
VSRGAFLAVVGGSLPKSGWPRKRQSAARNVAIAADAGNRWWHRSGRMPDPVTLTHRSRVTVAREPCSGHTGVSAEFDRMNRA